MTVKADGSATSCLSTDANCPANAVCAATVCNCDAGYINDGTGLCTGRDYVKIKCVTVQIYFVNVLSHLA